jgi:hypothetical protein
MISVTIFANAIICQSKILPAILLLNECRVGSCQRAIVAACRSPRPCTGFRIRFRIC